MPLASQTSANDIANLPGVFNNSLSSIATGGWQPGNDSLLASNQLASDVVASYGGITLAGAPSSIPFGNIADATIDSPVYAFIDPLLLDISGNGINVSNWINNAVYFQTNTTTTTVGTAVSTVVDSHLHHTSWTLPGTGMLVFDPTGGAVTNISQLVSEDLSTNGTTIGNYSDSLAALKSLASAGAWWMRASCMAVCLQRPSVS